MLRNPAGNRRLMMLSGAIFRGFLRAKSSTLGVAIPRRKLTMDKATTGAAQSSPFDKEKFKTKYNLVALKIPNQLCNTFLHALRPYVNRSKLIC